MAVPDKKKRHGIVIGGTHGLGLETACLMAERGWLMSCLGRRQIAADENFSGHGAIHFYSADLQNTTQLLETLNRMENEFGAWDALIFTQRFRGEENPWEGEWQISIEGTRKIVEYCAQTPAVSAAGRHIVLIGSNASRFDVSEQHVAYHAVRAALEQMTRSWAVRLAPLGIQVNMICPTMIRKGKFKNIGGPMEKIIPSGRAFEQREIAKVIHFFCLEDSAPVTGQVIMADGGLSLVSQMSAAQILEK